MRNSIIAFIIFFTAFSCGENEGIKNPIKKDTQLVVEKDGMYTEYYPGKKHIRIQGPLDEKRARHGRWVYLTEQGRQLNFTMYQHGKKHGHSYNAYPNGAPYYYGEYWNDSLVGVWKSYDSKGKMTEKDYGQPEGF